MKNMSAPNNSYPQTDNMETEDPFGWRKFQEEQESNLETIQTDERGRYISEALNDLFSERRYEELLCDCNKELMGELVGYTLTYAQIFFGRSTDSEEDKDAIDNLGYDLISALEEIKKEPYNTQREESFCELIVDELSYNDVPEYREFCNQHPEYQEQGEPVYYFVMDRVVTNGYAYHAFNSGYEDSIRKYGLSTTVRSTNLEEIKELDDIVQKYGADQYAFGFLGRAQESMIDYSDGKVFYATDPKMVYDYAISGPEWMDYFIYQNQSYTEMKEDLGIGPYIRRDHEKSRKVIENWCDRLMGINIVDGTPPRADWLKPEERERILDFFEHQWNIYGNGEPRVALIPKRLVGRDAPMSYHDGDFRYMRDDALSKKLSFALSVSLSGTNCQHYDSIPAEYLSIVNLPVYPKIKNYEKRKEYLERLRPNYTYADNGAIIFMDDEDINLARNDETFRSLLSAGEKRYFSTDAEIRKINDYYFDGWKWAIEYTGKGLPENYKIDRGLFREFIDKYYEYLDELEGIEMESEAKEALATGLAYSDRPEKELKRLLTILSRKDIPTVAKEFMTFEIICPVEEALSERDEGSVYFRTESPVLVSAIYNADGSVKENVGSPNAPHRQIIFADLVNAAMRSDGTEMKKFIKSLQENEGALLKLVSREDAFDEMSEDEKTRAATLISQCDALYHQMLKGQNEKWNLSNDLYSAGLQIIERFRPTSKYSLADRIVRCFCYPLKIKSATEALDYIDNSHSWAERKNLTIIDIEGEEKNGEIYLAPMKGDLVKAIIGDSATLKGMLENGVLSYNFVGDGQGLLHRDYSPLDTDFSILLNQEGNILEKIKQTAAGEFLRKDGNELAIVVKFTDNTQVTRAIKREKPDSDYDAPKRNFVNYHEAAFEPGKYECYHLGLMDSAGGDDCGVRTGLPSSEIAYIMAGSNILDDVIKTAKSNSFYIPVVDTTGKLILSYEEYLDSKRESETL